MLNMHYGVFWVRIYELPLMLISEAMEKKIEGIIEVSEEIDQKEAHRNGCFLRTKVIMDFKQPFNRVKWLDLKRKCCEYTSNMSDS